MWCRSEGKFLLIQQEISFPNFHLFETVFFNIGLAYINLCAAAQHCNFEIQVNTWWWRVVFLPLSIPALSTVRRQRLSTLLWQGVLVGGRTPTPLPHHPDCHGNSRSASVSLCHSWHYTVVKRRKVKKLETDKKTHGSKMWQDNQPGSRNQTATGFCGPGGRGLWSLGEQGGCWDTGPVHSPVEGRTHTPIHAVINKMNIL